MKIDKALIINHIKTQHNLKVVNIIIWELKSSVDSGKKKRRKIRKIRKGNRH